jgi:hypothetical protein
VPENALKLVKNVSGRADADPANPGGKPTLLGSIPDYADIGGWLKPEEAEILFHAASAVTDGCILEIGSFRGRSTVALAAGSLAGAQKPIFAIEPHELFIGPRGGSYGPKDRRFFLQTLLRTKLFGMVRLLNTTSDVAAPGWDQKIALLFIDGDHRYDAVRSDFANWRPFLLENATVIFNGAKGAGPSQLIKELVDEGCLDRVSTKGNLSVLQFRQVVAHIKSGRIKRLEPPTVYPALIVNPDATETRKNLSAIGHGVYYGGNGSYLYQPIPKCGCTSIKTILLELENLPVSPDEWTRHNKNHNRFPGTDDLPRARQQAIFDGKTDTFSFVVVRDPYTRMASVYKDKILGGYKKGSRFWIDQITHAAKEMQIPLSKTISFEEFVRIASTQAIRDMDPHWRQQYHAGHLGIIKFDFVGHLEMLTTDLLYVLERLKASKALMDKAALPHNVTGANLDMWAPVSAETRRQFIRTYEIDFDTLHYPTREFNW